MGFNSVNDMVQDADDDSRNDGYMLGTVTENDDGAGTSNVQVNIPNWSDTSQGEVPWVGAHPYSPFGIGPTWGWYGTPYKGSVVKVRYQDGDQHYGFYESSVLKPEHVPAEFKSPFVWGFKDPAGNTQVVNLQAKTWKFTTAGGYNVEYDGSGKVTVSAPAGQDETITGDLNLVVTGNMNITVTGNANITAATINLN